MSEGVKPTPGPWEWSWRADDDLNPGSVRSIGHPHHPHRPFAVAMCPRFRGPNSDSPWDADARLIAAAPDFYKAARDLLNAEPFSDEWDNAMHRLDFAVQDVEGDER